tara:strand:+ start:1302 stop:2273 length:972 start_codon:yes stop_codon:yes gene_type:complete
MKFRARNCHLLISLNPALIKYEDEYEFFSKIGDEFVCEAESDDPTVESESIQIDLPANLGVQVILDQVELSIINASGSIQLELNDCKALLVSFTGNLSVSAKNSVIRTVGGSGYLQARLLNSHMAGIVGHSELSLNAESCDLDLSAREGVDGVWSLSGKNNRIHFDPMLKPNLMINSNQDDWVHSGRNPSIFVNIFGEQKLVDFISPKSSASDQDSSLFDKSLNIDESIMESIDKVEANEELMNIFDHYEEQIDVHTDTLSESRSNELKGTENDSSSNSPQKTDRLSSNTTNHQADIMRLHLQGEISLDEMELLLKESDKVDG